MGQIFYSPCTCPVLILASRSPKRTVHDLGLVHVRRSGLVLGSLYLWKLFWYPVQDESNPWSCTGIWNRTCTDDVNPWTGGRCARATGLVLGCFLAIWMAVCSLKGPEHPWVSTPLLRTWKAAPNGLRKSQTLVEIEPLCRPWHVVVELEPLMTSEDKCSSCYGIGK